VKVSSALFRKYRDVSTSGDAFLTVILSGLVISNLGWWIAASYFKIDVQASISFKGEDGWCDPTQQGLGIHCFGDYFHAARKSLAANPWEPSDTLNPYTALATLPFRFLEGIAELCGVPRLGLSLYLSIVFVGLCSTAIWSSRGLRVFQKLVLFVSIGPGAVSAINVLDRGNSVGLLVPVLLWFAVSVLREHKKQSVISLVLISAIKPHFALLVLVLIANRWWRSALFSIVTTFFLQISAFLLWPSSFPGSIKQSINSTLDYQDYDSVLSDYPPQISFAHGIANIERTIRSIFNLGVSENQYFGDLVKTEISLIILIFVGISLVLFPKKFPSDLRMFLMIASINFFPTVVYSYYGVVLYVIGALIVRPVVVKESEIGKTPKSRINKQNDVLRSICRILILSATASSLLRLPLPNRVNDYSDRITTTSSISAAIWLIVIIFVTLVGISGRLQGGQLFGQG
jgi:hypothetical protein